MKNPNTNTVKINRTQLSVMLKDEKSYNGCSFVGFDALTTAKLTGGKGNPHQNRINKVHVGFVAMLFSNKLSSAYGNMVNRRLEQSGEAADFEPKSLRWGVRTPNTAFIDHTNKQNEYSEYVQMIFVQHSVKLIELASQLGVEMNDNDVELAKLMAEKVIGYNTSNGNISYLLDGSPIEKDAIEGMPESKANGKQGGLKEDMKVIVRTFKLDSITRITMNGTRYEIED